jgi:(1->4)-alpha-D-glucan 1-alpha-D-glucosylmutase
VVEKILAEGESLREDWPVQGTTGYEFLNLVGGLFVDPAAEGELTQFYHEFTGVSDEWPVVARTRKLQVLREVLGSDVNRLAELMLHICEQNRRYRDYSRHQITDALRELAASFPVYRTYIRPSEGAVSDQDRRLVEEAARLAAEARPDLDAELFDFIRRIMLLEVRGKREAEFVLRFQQLCPPAMAKGIEDTAGYVYNRFVALNEVGGDPSCFGVTAEQFHEAMAERRMRQPLGLSCTDTHDTKRSLGVRARLSLLSLQPQAWIQAVRSWAKHNERHRGDDLPDRNMEYLYYQTLVGAWPIPVERVLAWAEKAAREAKTHTSWSAPDQRYEGALKRFIEATLADPVFIELLERYLEPLVQGGRAVALAQTLIKLTAPGTPDLYQGSELWSHALVDPDNRRPVDYELRRRLLAGICDRTVEQVWPSRDEGSAMVWLIRHALAVRARHEDAFAPGAGYQPLEAAGPAAANILAFQRGSDVITIVPRLTLDLDCASTSLTLPAGRWREVLSGATAQGKVAVASLLNRFPVALVERSR